MGLLGLGFKLKNTLKTKKVAETITGVKPGAKFKGQKTKEEIIAAGKKKKEKKVNEDFRENMRRYFTNQPPKKTKTKHYTAPKDF
tara:strand:+ start:198 stop:452 length:255 start_codon:yes stop_codon:yes gene_type:complete